MSRLTDGVDILRYSDAGDEDPDAVSVLIVSVGALADVALAVAESLAEEHVDVTVVDPRWVAPVPGSVLALADDHDLVVTVEDGVIRGGVGSLISEAMNAAEIDTPIRHLAFPDVFPRHASRSELLAEVGLDAEGATASVLGWMENLFDRD